MAHHHRTPGAAATSAVPVFRPPPRMSVRTGDRHAAGDGAGIRDALGALRAELLVSASYCLTGC